MTDEKFSEAMLTRRRLDILYNKVFQLKHTSSKTLLALNELFGPVNLKTLLQGVHFARERRITNYLGEGISFNNNQLLQRLKQQWTFPTYCFIGAENQVFDADGFNLFKHLAYRNDLNNFDFGDPIVDYGHQDVFIGENAQNDVYPLILDWLDKEHKTLSADKSTANRASLLNQQSTYQSVDKVIHNNIRPDSEGLTITLRKSDIPASITHFRLTARESKMSDPITSCEIAYAIDNQPSPDDSSINDQTESVANSVADSVADSVTDLVVKAPCTPKKYGSVGISTDETSVHILVARETHADFFSDQGQMQFIDIDFKADYIATQPLD